MVKISVLLPAYCKLHTITHTHASWQTLCSVAQHPRRHETKRQKRAMQSKDFPLKFANPTTLGRPPKNIQVYDLCSFSAFLLHNDCCPSTLTINPDWAVRRRRKRRGNRRDGDVWWSILCFFLSPPMQPAERDGVQIQGLKFRSRVGEGRGVLLWKRLSLCTQMAETEREVSHFPLTILQIPHPAFGVWLILDGKRVSNQPVKTDWIDCVATYNHSVLEILLFCSWWADDI